MFVPLTPLDFLRRAVHLYPHQTAIVDRNIRFSYKEYGARVNRLANALLALQVQPGDVISFLTLNCHQLLEAYYGVIKIGAVLNPINVRMGTKEIEYILQHSGSRIVFAHTDFAPIVRQQRPHLPVLQDLIIIDGDPEEGEGEYEKLLKSVEPVPVDYVVEDENSMCELFYTSGTTGQPKAVALSHRNLYLHALTFISSFQITSDDVILHIVPLFHVNGWGTPQFLTAVGGKHVMLPKIFPEEICRLVQEEGVTRLYGVATIMNDLLNFERLDQYDLSSIKQFAMGGAPVPFAIIQKLEKTFQCQAIAMYGLSETSPVIVNAAPKPQHRSLPEEDRQRLQARTGFELIGTKLDVFDKEGNPVKRDAKDIGEIVVRSNLVMMGYHKDETSTDEVIKDGWFYTGDMAVIDEEGSILIVDRSKDIVISGGENISTQEVESVLYLHEAVYECAVFGIPDEKWGERPRAAVVLKPGFQITEQQLIDHCRDQLAHYKCPAAVDLIPELPKSGTGKILKRLLREPFWEGKEKRVQ
ncbi:MAG: long-chain-fatty-acid--CoA ligase [SAR324 cluster bacterium]|nr:long-chain-fatty-acid--CoA ligase [SAR324 cluster bacterium]